MEMTSGLNIFPGEEYVYQLDEDNLEWENDDELRARDQMKVVVTSVPDETMVNVRFIEDGYETTVPDNELIPVEEFIRMHSS